MLTLLIPKCILFVVRKIMVEMFTSRKFTYTIAKQDSPEVHANAAEILCAVTRCAPPSLAAKICSPRYYNFILLPPVAHFDLFGNYLPVRILCSVY